MRSRSASRSIVAAFVPVLLGFLIASGFPSVSRADAGSRPLTTLSHPTIVRGGVYVQRPVSFEAAKVSRLSAGAGWDTAKVGTFRCGTADELLVLDRRSNSASLATLDPSDSTLRNERWGGEPPPLAWVQAVVADFDGDGCSDLIGPSDDGTRWVFARSNRHGFDVEMRPRSGTISLAAAGDFNGVGYRNQLALVEPGPAAPGAARSVCYRYVHPVSFNLSDPLCTPESAELSVAFAADIDVGSEDELLLRDDASSSWFVRKVGRPGRPPLWAQFPEGSTWEFVAAGDFSGDGRADLLVRGPGLWGWWAGVAARRAAVERSVDGLPDRIPSGCTFHAGDFSGDGFSDLLIAPPSEAPALFLSRRGEGVPRVSIRAEPGAVSATTDAEGRYELRLARPNPVALTADQRGAVVLPGSRRVRPVRSVSRPTNFLIVRAGPPHEGVGSPVRYEQAESGPYVCLAYNPGDPAQKWGAVWGECPDGYAIYAVDDASSGGGLAAGGTCCRLPRPDILTGERLEAEWACPAGSVATGLIRATEEGDGRPRLLCRAVDGTKYRLGPPSPGVYWGHGFSMRNHSPRIDRADLPAAIRPALGRTGYARWDADGCVGAPPGALLVQLGESACAGHRFSRLLTRGEGARTADVPVEMFPRCKRFESVFNPDAGCVAPE